MPNIRIHRFFGSLLVVLILVAVVPTSAYAGWTLLTVPSPPGSPEYVELRSVSCFHLENAEALCWAVGNYKVSSGSARLTLVEKYTKAAGWSVQSSPNPAGATSSYFESIACRSTTECVAVGEYTNSAGENLSLGEWLNPSTGTWALDNPVSPPSSWDRNLTGVSCPPSTTLECLATGNYHKNAAPGYDEGLAYRWKAGVWSSALYPLNPASSTSSSVGTVSCPGPTAACEAANQNRTTAWEIEPLVESVTASNVWGIQGSASLSPVSTSSFYTTACVGSVTECVVAGVTAKSGKPQVLVERLGATSPPWTVGPSTYPAGALSSELSSVSCISGVSVCMGVGEYVSSGGTAGAMAEYLYSGMAILNSPLTPFGATASRFEGVSCSGEPCMAVGQFASAGVNYGLAELFG